MKRFLVPVATIAGIALAGHFIAYKMFHIPQRLELVIILAAFLFYPILRNPLVGIYTFFILSPFIPYIRRLYYLTYDRPKLDPLIILGDIILVLMLIGLFFEFRERSRENRNVAPMIRIVLIYFFYLLARTFVLNEIGVAGSIAIFKLYGPPVLLFLVAVMYSNHIVSLKRLWSITIFLGLFSVAFGIKQLYFGYSRAENIWLTSIDFTSLFIQGIARPFSFYQAPVAFADYMQVAIIAVLMMIEWSRQKMRYVLYALLPVLFYGALITSVRSSWAGIFATFIIWFTLFRVKGTKQRIGAFIGVLALYMGYEFLNDTLGGGLGIDRFIGILARSAPNPDQVDLLITNRTSALTNPLEEYSFLSRMVLWKMIMATSIDPIYAFMGRGLGGLKADSLYFTYLAEFGYPGLIFIIWLIIKFIRTGFFILDNTADPDRRVLAKGVTIMNIIFALISITGTHIHYFPGDAYFWFWNGILIKQAADLRDQRAESAVT